MAKAKHVPETIGLLQTIRVKDYGDDWVNRLAVVGSQLEKMESDERAAAFRYFKSKYSKEWPSDSY